LAILVPLLLGASLASGQPNSQVIWKLIDKNGKVTYVDKEPVGKFDGQVIRIDMDLNANKANLGRPGESPASGASMPLSSPELRRVKAEADLAAAREKLEQARKALAEGKEPTPDETQWVGMKSGGARPVPNEAFAARLRDLEDAVKAAEAEVDRAQKAARQAAID
jgi:hypothetical protein